ncbi:hypothetical protein NSQ59_27195 [Margalitia sp. FSL K6-0131]|uniref:hypothetical protein n=1 Tax=Margalitia sp. FSL K6-0131 TaxID=2954604 RepID=UPI0030FA25C3
MENGEFKETKFKEKLEEHDFYTGTLGRGRGYRSLFQKAIFNYNNPAAESKNQYVQKFMK